MVTGSCLCGTVKFEFDKKDAVMAFNCYCVNCRKSSGAQFGTFFQVRQSGFRWIAGEESRSSYESAPGNKRAFCTTCGSRVPWMGLLPTVIVPGGMLDGDPGIQPEAVFYTGSKPDWCSSGDDARSFDVLPPPAFWGDFMIRLHGR
jgi:hypothetical protein